METYWATVMVFRKSKRAEHLFDCMKMVQRQLSALYNHYMDQYQTSIEMTTHLQ
jgi:hypothetical protein